MPTPTSPSSPPKPDKPSPALAFAALGRGGFSAAELAPLSDLSKADAAQLASLWPTLEAPVRIKAIKDVTGLAERHVEYLFGRVFRIALADSSAVVRHLGIAGLWEDDGEDLVERFLEIARNDESSDVRAEALRGLGRFAMSAALGDLGDDHAERLRFSLLEIASDASVEDLARRRALESLAVFGSGPETAAMILAAYESDDNADRTSAVAAMGRSEDRRWLPQVLAELESPDSELRVEAARASAALGDAEAVPVLSSLLDDHDDDVRRAVIAALGRIGGAEALRALRSLDAPEGGGDHGLIAEALDEASTSADLFGGA